MLNKCEIIGRLGKDVEFRNLESGTALATFSVATTERYKNKSGEKVEETEWFNVVVWGKLAEICDKFLSKGDLIWIGGKIKNRSYELENGDKRYITELIARDMLMLGGVKPKDQTEPVDAAKAVTPEPQADTKAEEDDDLPFIISIPLLMGFISGLL